MSWECTDATKWGWKIHLPGAVIPDGGNAHNFATGSWRSLRPIRSEEKCSQCLLCFIYCPDSSVITKDEKVVNFDLDHCKGCGICAEICPRDAIEMLKESDAKKQDIK